MQITELWKRLLNLKTIDEVDDLPQMTSPEALLHAYKCEGTGTTWVFDEAINDWVPFEAGKADGEWGSQVDQYRAEIEKLKAENRAALNDVRMWRAEAERYAKKHGPLKVDPVSEVIYGGLTARKLAEMLGASEIEFRNEFSDRMVPMGYGLVLTGYTRISAIYRMANISCPYGRISPRGFFKTTKGALTALADELIAYAGRVHLGNGPSGTTEAAVYFKAGHELRYYLGSNPEA